MLHRGILKIPTLRRALLPNLIPKINKHPATVSISTTAPLKHPDTNPDRSLRLIRQEFSSPTLLYLVPESWIFFFHKKTGVSGFYTFVVTFGTFLISKEIWVLEHEFYNGISMVLMLWLAVIKIGPGLAKLLDQEIDYIEGQWNAERNGEIANFDAMIKNEKQLQWSKDGELMLLEAKRENVLLQLEFYYRERIMTTYNTVLRRLKFQIYANQVHDKFWQRNMAEWIREQVLKHITPEWDTAYFDACINHLKLAAELDAQKYPAGV